MTALYGLTSFELSVTVQLDDDSACPIYELSFNEIDELRLSAPGSGFDSAQVTDDRVTDDAVRLVWSCARADTEVMYIRARELRWQLRELPGLRRFRGGSRAGKWYYVPYVNLPLNDQLERFADFMSLLADENFKPGCGDTLAGHQLYAVRTTLRPEESPDIVKENYELYRCMVLPRKYAGAAEQMGR